MGEEVEDVWDDDYVARSVGMGARWQDLLKMEGRDYVE